MRLYRAASSKAKLKEPKNFNDDAEEFELSVGDVLYIPAGTWFEQSAEGISMHIKFHTLDWAELTARAMQQLLYEGRLVDGLRLKPPIHTHTHTHSLSFSRWRNKTCRERVSGDARDEAGRALDIARQQLLQLTPRELAPRGLTFVRYRKERTRAQHLDEQFGKLHSHPTDIDAMVALEAEILSNRSFRANALVLFMSSADGVSASQGEPDDLHTLLIVEWNCAPTTSALSLAYKLPAGLLRIVTMLQRLGVSSFTFQEALERVDFNVQIALFRLMFVLAWGDFLVPA